MLSAKALRSLTENFDPVSAMSMGWVLTTKADGSITARLVVLGFQASNVAEVDTAAPTMARVSRNLILAIIANKGFKLKAGDVTAAFAEFFSRWNDSLGTSRIGCDVWSRPPQSNHASPHHQGFRRFGSSSEVLVQ